MCSQSQVNVSVPTHVGVLLVQGVCRTFRVKLLKDKAICFTVQTLVEIFEVIENYLNTSLHADLDPVDVHADLRIFL